LTLLVVRTLIGQEAPGMWTAAEMTASPVLTRLNTATSWVGSAV